MELFGTELEPDWFTEDGAFSPESIADLRNKARALKLGATGDDELDRLKKNGASHPDRRFHYRYVAVALGEQSAGLMPDGSPRTAEVLCRIGSWLKARDPKKADGFYKDLATRCPNTDLGKEANSIRWFPKLPADPFENGR